MNAKTRERELAAGLHWELDRARLDAKKSYFLLTILLLTGCASVRTNIGAPHRDLVKKKTHQVIEGKTLVVVKYELIKTSGGRSGALKPDREILNYVRDILTELKIFQEFEIASGEDRLPTVPLLEVNIVKKTDNQGCPQLWCLIFPQTYNEDGNISIKYSQSEKGPLYQGMETFSIEVKDAALIDPKYWYILASDTFDEGVKISIRNQLVTFHNSKIFGFSASEE